MFEAFYKAIPEPRGCGERESGGVYIECGVGPGGRPLETFLLDPPLPLPEGVDLVNKPQLWMRTDPVSQEAVLDPYTGAPIYDVLIWIGAEYYPEAADYAEETRAKGASRRLNPHMDLSKLTRQSRMLLAHPRAIIANWRELLAPQYCHKHRPYHDQAFFEALYHDELEGGAGLDITDDDERIGPCVFKLWEILPQDEAIELFERPGELPLCVRRIGTTTTTYEYCPTGEQVTAWEPGFFLGLPISNVALIQFADGSVDQHAKEKLLKGVEVNQGNAIPFYETEH